MSDDEIGRNNTGSPDDDGGDPEVPNVPHSMHSGKEQEQSHHKQPRPHHYAQSALDWSRRHFAFLRSPTFWARFANVATAAATVVMAIVYIQIKGIMHDQGGQTDQLIDAAQIQAHAARRTQRAAARQARAAMRFAESADGIREDTNNAVNQLKRAADDSERAIQKASQNAERALNQSIEAANLDQRPWVGVTAKMTQFDSKGFTAEVALFNSGKTPSLYTSEGDAGIQILPATFDGFGCKDITKMNRPMGAIPPQLPRIIPMTRDGTFAQKYYDGIINGTQFLYIYGCLIYWDTHGQMTASNQAIQPHVTGYCFQYDRTTKELALCDEGNSMR